MYLTHVAAHCVLRSSALRALSDARPCENAPPHVAVESEKHIVKAAERVEQLGDKVMRLDLQSRLASIHASPRRIPAIARISPIPHTCTVQHASCETVQGHVTIAVKGHATIAVKGHATIAVKRQFRDGLRRVWVLDEAERSDEPVDKRRPLDLRRVPATIVAAGYHGSTVAAKGTTHSPTHPAPCGSTHSHRPYKPPHHKAITFARPRSLSTQGATGYPRLQ